MACLQFEGVGIAALAAAVPRTVVNKVTYAHHFPSEDVQAIVDKIGIYERRFADADTCSSDLCYAAAQRLIEDNNIDRTEIDLLVFISQTPDYRMPSTSLLLQHRLGLGSHIMAFDITLGCSAFIYGLSVVYSLMQQSGLRKALILDGETRSKVYSPQDRGTAFLFGDAGVAALIERNPAYGKSFFSFKSDGSRADLIKIEAGGYRLPSSADTVKERVIDQHGNIATQEQGVIRGGEVFSYVIAEVPASVRDICHYAGIERQEIDYFLFHQANRFMNNHLLKKLKIAPGKAPSTLAKYGNTSSASIPLTIVSELSQALYSRRRLLLSAFGVGMSLSAAIVEVEACKISEIVEV